MSIIDKLASSLNRRDEVPNQQLAKEIADNDDKGAIEELVENLYNKSKDIQNDCIKVVYEIGTIRPRLIASYSNTFVELLKHKNNRLQWGAMTALNTIVFEVPETIYGFLTKIVDAAEKGSVITTDYAVKILIKLCSLEQYADRAFALLTEQLLTSPVNQLPMYAENAIVVINEKNKEQFVKTLTSRLNDLDKESKRKRVEKVIKRFSK